MKKLEAKILWFYKNNDPGAPATEQVWHIPGGIAAGIPLSEDYIHRDVTPTMYDIDPELYRLLAKMLYPNALLGLWY